MSVLPFIRGDRVLEIGHGPGNLLVAMSRKEIHSFGLDESRTMGEVAIKKLNRERIMSGCSNDYAQSSRLVRGSGEHLPYLSQSFTSVVATFPTEYIFFQNTLREIHRVLVPGGVLLITPTAWITGRKLSERAASLLFRVTGQSSDIDLHLLDKFTDVGFQVETRWIEQKSSRILLISAKKPLDTALFLY